ncbi:TPA: hypothetical protein ACH3X2_007521 [Trebouxia sp. C0005]
MYEHRQLETSFRKGATEKFGFDWDNKSFDEDFALEAERQDLHSTVEGEENVFEILSGGLEVNQLVELATAQSRRLDCETVLQEVEREHPGELSRMEHKANAPAGLTFQFIRSLLYVVIDSVVMSFAACNCIYTVQRLMLLGNELTLYTLRKLMSMVKLSLQGQGLLLHLLLVEDLQLWKHYHYQVRALSVVKEVQFAHVLVLT